MRPQDRSSLQRRIKWLTALFVREGDAVLWRDRVSCAFDVRRPAVYNLADSIPFLCVSLCTTLSTIRTAFIMFFVEPAQVLSQSSEDVAGVVNFLPPQVSRLNNAKTIWMGA
jgi:hypothetical protein